MNRPSNMDVLVPIVALIGLLVFAATVMIAPLNGEDFALTRDFGGMLPYERLHWVMERSFRQITVWNARLGEQLAIFWLSVPRVYYMLAACAALLGFCALAALWSMPEGRGHALGAVLRVIALPLVFVWPLWPGYEVFFWITAHAAYFQPMLLTLLLLALYRSPEAVQRLRESRWRLCLAMLLAMLAGFSFENVPIAVAMSVGVLLLINGRKDLKLATLLPLIVLLVSWALLVLAPSTGIRRATYAQMYPMTPGIAHYASRLLEVAGVLLRTTWPLLVSACIASVYLWRRAGWRQQLFLPWSVSVLTVGSVIAAPYTEPRAFIVAWALLFIISVAALQHLRQRTSMVPGVALAAVAALWFPLQANILYADFARSLDERDAYIRIMTRTGLCASGIDVSHSTRPYPYRYLNSREDWFAANPAHVSRYYGCTVRIR